ncbi:integrin alpha-PS3-like [Phlebotomus argentipes]|uniref:integrin alpha-PS3-like n=1 Tax=Phlebotomus argentipes TaxID=94469 RepID=UPI002893833B|nr:integrin alpha-PS3-like [Phlebotomus argentipes]
MSFWATLLPLLCILAPTIAYNLSPTPNHVLQEPPLITSFDPHKNQSSYFGYSLNLRPNSLLVGAPRAPPRIEAQRKIREPGAIYKCDIKSSTCHHYVFDKLGNIQAEASPINSETKDEQWLGASIDGPGRDEAKFVACASRNFINMTSQHFLHGICYWIENTTDTQPQGIRKLMPLRKKDAGIQINSESVYLYMMGQAGFSSHVTENNEEILLGAVGVYNWKGTVIRYKQTSFDGGLSRRETNSLRHEEKSARFTSSIDLSEEIPIPSRLTQEEDSYFGYAIGSGFFHGPGTGKILYVAGAPRANEVYLFDIETTDIVIKSIKKYWTFKAPTFGEYFGSSLLVEDFNGDQFPDLVVGAPYHREDDTDKGAIYVYTNLGKLQFSEEPLVITSDELGGRFGTSFGKIGDINLDGFNDLAVGAPYEDSGVVYIFLGSREGLQKKPVQKILSPGGNRLFGYSISRGVDIDANGYVDVAIGAPEDEKVFVYRTYPVVKVIGTISPNKREMDIGERSMEISVCWSLQSPTTFPSNIILSMNITADAQYGRIMFPESKNSLQFEQKAESFSQCKIFEASVESRAETIFKPMDLEMSWEIISNIQQDEEFCSNCVSVNPNDPTYARSQAVFNTGCQNIPCRADLRISGKLFAPQPYILGSTETFRVQYEVVNHGETAYIPKISVEKSPSLNFMQVLPQCHLDEDIMTCDLSSEPLLRGQSRSIAFRLDPSNLEGTEVFITANVSSTGDEETPEDNTIEFMIPIQEFSDVEIVGKSHPPFVAIRDRNDNENITYYLEFRNLGPTPLRPGEIHFDIPISMMFGRRSVQFIKFSEIIAIAHYKSLALLISWSQDNNILLQNPTEYTTSFPAIADDLSGNNYDSSKLGFDLNLDTNNQNNNDDDFNQVYRKRRSLETTTSFNPYTLGLTENHPSSARSLDDAILGSRIDKTIILDCKQEQVSCIKGSVSIPASITPNDPPVMIKLTFPVDLQAVNSVLDENRDSLVLRIVPSITRDDDEQGSTIKISETPTYTHFVQDIPQELQIWVIVVSVIGGLLLLTIITYVLYRLGFFKREKKAEIARLVRESQIQAAMESEDED